MWVPMPVTDAFQKVEFKGISPQTDYTVLNEVKHGNKVFFFELGPEDSKKTILFEGETEESRIRGMVEEHNNKLIVVYLQAKNSKFNEYEYVYNDVIDKGYNYIEEIEPEVATTKEPEIIASITEPEKPKFEEPKVVKKETPAFKVKVKLKTGDIVIGELIYESDQEYQIKIAGATPIFINKVDVESLDQYKEEKEVKKVKKVLKPVSIEEKKSMLGKRVRIDMKNGERFYGLIEKVYKDGYRVRIFRKYGDLVVNMRDDEIKKLQRAKY